MSLHENSTVPGSEQSHPLLVVISGPSGVGKDAVIAELRKRQRPWHFAVTATTRPPRNGEIDGVDYIFLEDLEFQKLREANGLLECAEYSGRWYGVPRSQVEEALAAGKDVFLKIDVQGAESVRRIAPEALFIFLAAGSFEELAGRLGQRGTEGPDEVRRRLEAARREMDQIPLYEYCVVNRDGCLEQAVADVEAIIVAEKCRVRPRVVQLKQP